MSTLLEIGPGRGDFLFWLAGENPLKTVAAVEYKKKRFDKLARRVEERKIPNVSLHFGDARVILPQEFSNESVESLFILFSDPWPKKRHARHRLFQEEFIKELYRVLRPQGRIYVAHDSPVYIAQIREVFGAFPEAFEYSDKGVDYITFYAEKWRREGRDHFTFSYVKRPGVFQNLFKRDGQGEGDFLALPCVLPIDPEQEGS